MSIYKINKTIDFMPKILKVQTQHVKIDYVPPQIIVLDCTDIVKGGGPDLFESNPGGGYYS